MFVKRDRYGDAHYQCDGCGTECSDQHGYVADERRDDIHWCPFCAYRLKKIDMRALLTDYRHWSGYGFRMYRIEFTPDGDLVLKRRRKAVQE